MKILFITGICNTLKKRVFFLFFLVEFTFKRENIKSRGDFYKLL